MRAADYVPARERTPWGQFQMRPSHLTTSIPGAATYSSTTPEVDPGIARAAAITVVEHTPRDEVRDVLTALGLIGEAP